MTTNKTTRLHKLWPGEKIKEKCYDSKNQYLGDMITFHRIDGMYSYCTVDGVEEGKNVIHLSAMTPLVKYAGKPYWEIDLNAEGELL